MTAYASAEDFLAAYRAGTRDDFAGCLVLDVRMPGMSGLELYEKLADHRAALPVIFITGHGDVPMAVAALKKAPWTSSKSHSTTRKSFTWSANA